MKASRLLGPGVVVVLLAGVGAAAVTWHAAIAPIAPPATGSFDPAVVRRGATLAAVGDCAGCHSAPGRAAYSGGLPVETPFGAVYASNITPDPETGIGTWSQAAFGRALRQGVGRDGRNLYPAFPYTHYTRLTDDDVAALYAYAMTRTPTAGEVPRPALPFPLNVRPVMAFWNLLFFREGSVAPDPARGADWDRGAYLVEGLGHCGACHTPHDAFGAEKSSERFAGGVADGWNAYALNVASPAPVPWTADALAFYLKHGWEAMHGAARGPMAIVTENLARVPEPDLHAMGVYLASQMQRRDGSRVGGTRMEEVDDARPGAPQSAGTQIAVTAVSDDAGAGLYAGACASCHDAGRPLPFGGLDLALSSALHAPDPSNLVTVTLHGLAPPPGAPGPIMPGFAGALDDADLVALLGYLRTGIAREPPWPDLDGTVRRVRARGATLVTSDGVGTAPHDPQARVAP